MSDNEMMAANRKQFYEWYHRVYGYYRGFGLCEGDMYEAWKAAQRPALTDEQVREIARKAAVQFPVSERIYAYDIIEAAIREAIGRGERG